MNVIKNVVEASDHEQVTSAMCTIKTGCGEISCNVGFSLGSGSFTMRLVKPIGDQPGGIYIYATALGYV